MKSLMITVFSLLLTNAVYANQGNILTFSKVETCDSGICGAVECQVSMTDTRGIERVKTYLESAKHQPRICELLRADEIITVKYLEGSKLCIQDDDNSDFILNYMELEDCEFYRYGR